MVVTIVLETQFYNQVCLLPSFILSTVVTSKPVITSSKNHILKYCIGHGQVESPVATIRGLLPNCCQSIHHYSLSTTLQPARNTAITKLSSDPYLFVFFIRQL